VSIEAQSRQTKASPIRYDSATAIAATVIAENYGIGERASATTDTTAFLDALRRLDRALDENIDRAHRMKRRIAELEDACLSGRPIKEIVPEEETPLIVQLLTESAEALHEHGSRVRRTEARALHREGLTMDQIARLFGVTRQRVSALLRET
jgi:DNA-directed RNA polymerase sigma subunit (sigma70/sigma32)